MASVAALPPLDAPLTFRPVFKERVWGGRRLEELYGRSLPPEAAIGESWELVDRADDQSVVAEGPLEGRTLHDLWSHHREAVFGAAGAACDEDRFPLLVKLLDARETLSVQVHPPPAVAPSLGGETKSEAWVVAEARPGAHLFAGLRGGVDRPRLESALRDGEDASALLHRVDVERGDALLVPAGRVHAIGAGTVILEVQQSSDTTYRVYDFDRPRELHIDESLRCIDFGDVTPALAPRGRAIADWEHFGLRHQRVDGPAAVAAEGECAIVCVLDGTVTCGTGTFGPGALFLVAARLGPRELSGAADIVVAELPPGHG